MKPNPFLFLCLFMGVTFQGVAQQIDKACNLQIPVKMQIDESLFMARKSNYAFRSKLDVLNYHLKGNIVQHPIQMQDFPVLDFFAMVEDIMKQGTGMKVYLGAFCNVKDPKDNEYAKGKTNILVPIFVPTTFDPSTNTDVDVPIYYIIDENEHVCQKVVRPSAEAWVKQYHKIILPDLQGTMDDGQFETKTLWYNNFDLTIWDSYIRCVLPASGIKWIQICYGAFNNDISEQQRVFSIHDHSDAPTPLVMDVSNKFTLMFRIPKAPVQPKVPINKINELIDTVVDYAVRHFHMDKDKARRWAIAICNSDGEYDTGVPCPPAPNCCTAGSLDQNCN